MNNYLVDRMVIASSKFKLARDLSNIDLLRYTVIEEVSYESRNDRMNKEAVKREFVDVVTKEHVDILKRNVTNMMELEIVKPNEGCGDAMLIAESLASGVGEQTSMFDDDYTKIIVSDDGKLSVYCRNNDISIISSEDFFKLCESINTEN